MAKTYVPTTVIDVHNLAIFLARNNAIVRTAIAVIDPSAVSTYDALYAAIVAFDALRETLYPLGA